MIKIIEKSFCFRIWIKNMLIIIYFAIKKD